MRTALWLVLSALIAYSSMAEEPQTQSQPTWAQEPTGYRDIKWGASKKELKHIIGWTIGGINCFDGHKGVKYCKSFYSIGTVKVENTFMLRDDKLTGVLLTYSPDDFDFLKQVFVEKYGAPHKTESSAVQNRMGASFTDEVLTWQGKTVSITMQRYYGKVTEGMAIISLTSEAQVFAEQEKERAKKAADDL